ncbi:MAG: hypothetical protein HC903_04865 [Methylacidiphilales bacterium]|nr:hypothetical protein [Candidatus Methylacidiphilales bacterium]
MLHYILKGASRRVVPALQRYSWGSHLRDKRTTTLREPLRGTWKQATRSVSPPYGKPPSVSMGLSLTPRAIASNLQ